MCNVVETFGVIYLAKNKVNGLLYVGQTKDFDNRIRLYKRRIKNPRAWFERAIAKHGINGFEWSIIDEARNSNELDDKERQWIAHYNTTNNSIGYNLTYGGWANRACTPECKDNMSRAAKRKFANGYVHHSKGKTPPRHVTEAAMIGLRKRIAKFGGPRKGVKLSEEECQKMSKRLKGKHCSPRTEFKARPILCVELNQTFPSLAAAGRHFGKSISDLCHTLQGKKPTWAGYTWRYLNETQNPAAIAA